MIRVKKRLNRPQKVKYLFFVKNLIFSFKVSYNAQINWFWWFWQFSCFCVYQVPLTCLESKRLNRPWKVKYLFFVKNLIFSFKVSYIAQINGFWWFWQLSCFCVYQVPPTCLESIRLNRPWKVKYLFFDKNLILSFKVSCNAQINGFWWYWQFSCFCVYEVPHRWLESKKGLTDLKKWNTCFLLKTWFSALK